MLARRRSYEEHLDSSYLQINRYVAGDAWVAGEMLAGLSACAQSACATGSIRRLSILRACAATIVERALSEVGSDADRKMIQQTGAEFGDHPIIPGSPHGQETQ